MVSSDATHVTPPITQILCRSTSGRMPWLLTATLGDFGEMPQFKTTWALKNSYRI